MADNMRNAPTREGFDEADRSVGRYDHATGAVGGQGMGSAFDPTLEDSYWRANYATRPYVREGTTYDDYRDAYRYGWESRMNRVDGRFEDAANDLERGWDKARAKSRLGWAEVKEAVRDAWHRVEEALPGDADRDGR
jgi:hypothetical protein